MRDRQETVSENRDIRVTVPEEVPLPLKLSLPCPRRFGNRSHLPPERGCVL